jgi:mono/diheme cytochrome c family protein
MTRFTMTHSFTAVLVITFIAAIGSVIPTTAFAGDVAAGKAKFLELCVACHGESGKGDGPTGLALKAAGQPAPRDFTIGEFILDPDKDGTKGSDADLVLVITNGALVYGGSPLMAPIPGLTDADLDNLVAFIRSLKQ